MSSITAFESNENGFDGFFLTNYRSREPPFAITHVSPEPIFHQTFINESYGWAYKVIDYIVFPMGFIFDDDFIYVSYGKNDKDGWILKLNRTGFFNSLRPVKSKVIGRSDWDRHTGKIIKGSYQPLSI